MDGPRSREAVGKDEEAPAPEAPEVPPQKLPTIDLNSVESGDVVASPRDSRAAFCNTITGREESNNQV